MKRSGALVAALVLLQPWCTVGDAANALQQEQGRSAEGDGYTIGLSMYSLRQLFASGELTALEYPAFVKKTFGIHAVDVWYGGLPKGEIGNPETYENLRAQAESEGIDIFLLMTGTLSAEGADDTALRKQAKKFFVDVDRAALLGARYLRIFLRLSGEEEQALDRAATTLKVLSDYAQSRGIILAIEPGGSDLTKSGVFLARLAGRLQHPACRLMPDFGKMKGADPYGGTAAMMPWTAVVSAKMHDMDTNGSPLDFDYPRLMTIIQDAGFNGIVAIEYEGRSHAPVEGVRLTHEMLKQLRRPVTE